MTTRLRTFLLSVLLFTWASVALAFDEFVVSSDVEIGCNEAVFTLTPAGVDLCPVTVAPVFGPARTVPGKLTSRGCETDESFAFTVEGTYELEIATTIGTIAGYVCVWEPDHSVFYDAKFVLLSDAIFVDGFESGNTSAWSIVNP